MERIFYSNTDRFIMFTELSLYEDFALRIASGRPKDVPRRAQRSYRV
jgi:hypothetical protein